MTEALLDGVSWDLDVTTDEGATELAARWALTDMAMARIRMAMGPPAGGVVALGRMIAKGELGSRGSKRSCRSELRPLVDAPGEYGPPPTRPPGRH